MPHRRTTTSLSIALVALMIAQAGLGLLFQGEYRDASWIVNAWYGNDWVTLVVAVPLLASGIALGCRGSTRGLLLWLGVVGYGAYNMAYYMVGAALNRFFAIYAGAVVVSVVLLIPFLSRLDVGAVASRFRASTPARVIGGFYVFVGVGLAVVWLGMWAAYAFGGQPTPVDTPAFQVVAALDTTIIVPVLLFGGVMLWQKRPWGYVLGAMAGVLGAVYLLVLSVNSILQVGRGLAEAPGEVPIWGTLALLMAAATVLLLANVRDEREKP